MLEEKKKRKKIPAQVSLLDTAPKAPQPTILPPLSDVVNMAVTDIPSRGLTIARKKRKEKLICFENT